MAAAAAAVVAVAGDNARRRKWRYTWETLAHLPLLRLYLFRSASPLLLPAADLSADLRLDESLLLVSFSLAGEPVVLRIPVPRVLVDPSAPVECRAAGDHVEVRLALVLPVDHPVVATAFPPPPGEELPAPLSLRDDLKNLSSRDVHLYCKACSTRLTKQPLRDIVEMPSLNWEDVADNWFGGCCTSFGGAGEKLVSQYINAYGRLEGTSLLNATSISIEKDYLEKDLVSVLVSSVPGNDFVALQEAISDVHVGKVHTTDKMEFNSSEEKAYYKKKIDSSHVQSLVRVSNSENNGVTLCTDQSGIAEVNSEKSRNEGIEKPTKETDSLLIDPCSCSCDGGSSRKSKDDHSNMPSGNLGMQITLETQRDYKLTKSISLGCSFIVKACNLQNDVDWLELFCAHCSSPIGSYPSQCLHAPADGRVRLFKCYTSSDLHVRGPRDLFRGHTLERLFVNLLLEVAEDEISFRTLVRDLKTKRPALQIVLLSSKAWLFSGYCYENDMDGSHGTAHLQPAVKILYFNCSNALEEDLRIVEEWSSRYRAEELYMMRRQIDELIGNLSSARFIVLSVNSLTISKLKCKRLGLSPAVKRQCHQNGVTETDSDTLTGANHSDSRVPYIHIGLT
uniref:Ubiquitin-conjugating enzyme E2C-binding protein n=1 Tax=Leersia perrieri TaxID=77586 RepID=A0A0D9VBU1_9ORYZ